MNTQIALSENEDIDTLFKVAPPLTDLSKDGYFGYIGVLLHNKKLDLIQCHLCGEWVNFLSKHVIKHKIKVIDYRKKFGLPLHFPLCSKSQSQKCRLTLEKQRENIARLKKLRDSGSLDKAREAAKKSKHNWLYSLNNASRDNVYAACFEQLKSRYEIVADMVGHEPSKGEIEQHDKGLYSAIYRRYKSLNAFKKKAGYTVFEAIRPQETNTIIASLINFFEKNKRAPKPSDFKTPHIPSTHAVYGQFGSWHRALECAGIV